jgi:hypothetical protein
VFNRWLSQRRRKDDLDGLALLPLYLSMRAAIRAKVGAARAARLKPDMRPKAEAEARAMFAAACGFLHPAPPRLVAIGGLSGSGKTTIARAVAPDIGPAPGAVIVRSDVIRKALFNVPETSRLPDTASTREAGARVYAEIDTWAQQTLAAGHAAILDAVHARADERATAKAVATRAGVAFAGIWLQAAPRALEERVTGRGLDASDATAAVVRKQLAYETGPIDWAIVDTGGDRNAAVTSVKRALGIDAVPGSDTAGTTVKEE